MLLLTQAWVRLIDVTLRNIYDNNDKHVKEQIVNYQQCEEYAFVDKAWKSDMKDTICKLTQKCEGFRGTDTYKTIKK